MNWSFLSVLPSRLILIVIYFAVAWLLALLLPRLVRRAAISWAQARRRHQLSERRINTIRSLSSDLTRAVIFLIALVAALGLFMDPAGLLTFLGLFSAGLGLGARPLVSDYLSGIVYLFEDRFSIGDKIEVFGTMGLGGVEGTVEDIQLRATVLRSPSGEVFFIPNGEIRLIRNFARGKFSLATLRIQIKPEQLATAIHTLEQLAEQAHKSIPDLVEQPQVYSEDGIVGGHVDLTFFAKATYGRGAQARRRLLELVRERFAEAGIEIST